MRDFNTNYATFRCLLAAVAHHLPQTAIQAYAGQDKDRKCALKDKILGSNPFKGCSLSNLLPQIFRYAFPDRPGASRSDTSNVVHTFCAG